MNYLIQSFKVLKFQVFKVSEQSFKASKSQNVKNMNFQSSKVPDLHFRNFQFSEYGNTYVQHEARF